MGTEALLQGILIPPLPELPWSTGMCWNCLSSCKCNKLLSPFRILALLSSQKDKPCGKNPMLPGEQMKDYLLGKRMTVWWKSHLGIALHIPEAVLYRALGKQSHFSLQNIYFPVAAGTYFSWETFSESIKPPAVTGHRWSTPELLLPGRDVGLLSFCPSVLLPGECSCSLWLLLPLLTGIAVWGSVFHSGGKRNVLLSLEQSKTQPGNQGSSFC